MIAGLKPYPAMKDSGVPWLGEVPAHWGSASVKRHYSIQLGKMLQTKPEVLSNQEVPYLKAQHVQWLSVRTSELPKMWASEREIDQFGVVCGDLLVCEGGEGGRSGILKAISPGVIIQNALHRVRSYDGCLNEFLLYIMRAVASTGWLESINNKATIAHFTREKFGSLGMPVPPLTEQAAIVRFLDHADRRIRRYIRAKQKMIKLLEEQK
jgi:type I restriction enzyme S subunit